MTKYYQLYLCHKTENSPTDFIYSDSHSVPQTQVSFPKPLVCYSFCLESSLLSILRAFLRPPSLRFHLKYHLFKDAHPCWAPKDPPLSSPVTSLCFAFLVSPTSIRTVSVQITNTVINKTHTAIHQIELQAIIIRGYVIKNHGHLRNICSCLSLPTFALLVFSDLLLLPMFQKSFALSFIR